MAKTCKFIFSLKIRFIQYSSFLRLIVSSVKIMRVLLMKHSLCCWWFELRVCKQYSWKQAIPLNPSASQKMPNVLFQKQCEDSKPNKKCHSKCVFKRVIIFFNVMTEKLFVNVTNVCTVTNIYHQHVISHIKF